MATCVIIGSPETRIIERDGKPPLVYTPRFSAGAELMIDHGEQRVNGRERLARRAVPAGGT